MTIRVLVDENLTTAKKLQLLWKEMRVGLTNGALLAVLALGFLGCYIHFFKAYAWGEAFLLSGCVGVSLVVAMVISSLVGTVIPMLFHKIHIDPPWLPARSSPPSMIWWLWWSTMVWPPWC